LISVGYAKHSDPATAVRTCVSALGTDRPRMLLAFCGGKHDPHAVRDALRRAFGEVPVFGGSAAGAVGRSGFGYSGFELGLVAFLDPAVTPRAVVTRQLLVDEHAAGSELGAGAAKLAGDGDVVMLFFDSVATASPLRLHPASSIVDGFHAGFGPCPVCLWAAGC